MFHGPVSRWLMIASGASLANGQGCQAAPGGGTKLAVESCRSGQSHQKSQNGLFTRAEAISGTVRRPRKASSLNA